MENIIRVLHCPICNMNIGGIENMLMMLYRHIDRTKFQFDFVVHDSSENIYEQEIISLGGRIYRIPYLSKSPLQHMKALDNILKNNNEYRIIHIHTTYAIMYFDAWIAKKNGKVVIVHAHNSSATKIHTLAHYLLKGKLSKLADYRLSCSSTSGIWMFRKNDVFTIWKNAIDTKEFYFDDRLRSKIRKELRIADDSILIGNVARLSFQKNQELLIDIFNEYHKIEKKSKLILVGSGEDEGKLKLKVDRLGLSKDVIFIGNTSNVSQYLMAMDIFCLTSRWEGFGISMIEAQTAGLALVVPSLVDSMIKSLEYVHIVDHYQDITLWVKELCECIPLNFGQRRQAYNKIKEDGYDIHTQIKIVENFYISIEKRGVVD